MSIPQEMSLDRAAFGGHETFPLRYTWLRKAIVAVCEDPEVFQREDAMVLLGVGKNMVRSIRHWALACGILQEEAQTRGRRLGPTPLGQQLLGDRGWDPFLEDPSSLWVLHFELASTNEYATTWHWVFNHLPQPEFSKGELVHWLQKLAHERRWPRVSPASLKRDVDVFVRTYVAAGTSRTVPLEDTLDCPLVELGLLREVPGKGTYRLQRGAHPTLPSAVFAYGLTRFLSRRTNATKAVPLHALAFAPGSPGRVFALSEDELMRRLDRLARDTNGALEFHDTAGLRQVLIREDVHPERILKSAFQPLARRGVA